MALRDTLGGNARRPNVASPGSSPPTSPGPSPVGVSPTLSRLPLLGSPSRSLTPQFALDQLSTRPLSSGEATYYQSVYENILQRAKDEGRPLGFLNVVMKVLNVGTGAVSGLLKGVGESIDESKANRKGGFWDKIGLDVAPWEWFTALGSGFSEIPEAVGSGYNFSQLIKERHDPDSFFYRHARPIGLTLDIVLDPTTYLSFGATTAGKTAARRVWANSWKRSVEDATQAIANGAKVTVGGKKVALADLGMSRATLMMHMENARPFTLGDALQSIRNNALDTRQAMKAGEYGRTNQLRAYMLPTSRPGGQGIRFAGMELPGTPAVLEYVSKSLKSKLHNSKAALSIDEIVKYNGGDLLPQHIVDEVMADVYQTASKVNFRDFMEVTLKSDMGRFRDEARAFHEQAIKIADEARMLGPHTYSTLEQRKMGFQALRLGEKTVKGSAIPANPARRINAQVRAAIEPVRKMADEFGIDEAEVDRWWQKALHNTQSLEDPTIALYEFYWRAMTDIHKKRFMDHLFADPMFATKLRRKAGESKELDVKFGLVDEAAEIADDVYSPFTTALDKRLIPPNMELISHRGSRYAVRTEVAEAIRKFRNPAVMDQELKKFVQRAGKIQDLWKIPATVMNPAFHTMNFTGAVWNNLLNNTWNPVDYVRALGVVYRTAVEQAAKEGRRSALTLGRVAESTKATRAAAGVFGEAEARGGIGRSGFIWGDVVGGRERALGELRRGRQTAFEKVYKRAPGESKKRFTLKQARRAAVIGGAATGNIPLAAIAAAPEIAAAGRKVGGLIEDVVRLAPFMKHANDPYILHYLDEYGPITVGKGVIHDLSRDQTSLMYDIGGDITKHFQFDYTDISLPERYLKQLFPFWVYYKNNFLLQLKETVKQPRIALTAQKLANYIADEGESLGGIEDILPHYFDNLGAFQIPVPGWAREKMGLPKDAPLFLNPKLPHFAAYAMFPPLWDAFRDTGENTWEKFARIAITPWAGSIGPLAPAPIPGAKLMFEAWANRSLGLGRPIDFQRASSSDIRSSYVPAPGWAKYLPQAVQDWLGIFESPNGRGRVMTATSQYLLNSLSTPFISNLGKSVTIDAQNEGKARADLVSWMTGIRLMPIDALRLTRAWAYSQENLMEGRRSELQEKGADLPPDELAYLRELRANLDLIESIYDARLGNAG